MKNLFSAKSLFVYTICLAGPLFLGLSCSKNKSMDSKEDANQENMYNMNLADGTALKFNKGNDAAFLMKAIEIQFEGIILGELAQQKSKSTQVKEFGKKMVEDHNQFLKELIDLATLKSVSIPISSTQISLDAYKELNEEPRNDFDKRYRTMMIKHHKDAIDFYNDIVEETIDEEIRVWASEKHMRMRKHLDYAGELS